LDLAGWPSVCLKGHTAAVSGVAFLPGGDIVLSGSHDGTVRLWDARTGAGKGILAAGVGRIRAVALGGASKRIAVAGDALRIRQAGGAFTDLPGHRGPVLCVGFAADGGLLLSGGGDGTMRLWRAADGEELRCFEGHGGAVRAVAFAPDGRAAFSAGADGTLRRWAIAT
jgi:WD40 repeat protein